MLYMIEKLLGHEVQNEFGDINSIKDQNQFEIKESF